MVVVGGIVSQNTRVAEVTACELGWEMLIKCRLSIFARMVRVVKDN